MVATPGVPEVHVTEFVRFCVLPSANRPVAVNCVATWAGMLMVDGVMEIDCRAEVDTITVPVPEIDPCWAVTVAMPADCPVAVPEEVIESTLLSDVLQVTTLLRFCVEPSL